MFPSSDLCTEPNSQTMKKLLFLFFFLYSNIGFAFGARGESSNAFVPQTALSFGIGKNAFMDTWKYQRNPSFTVGYRKQYFKSFAFEAFYQYAQNNNFPDFFDDPNKLHSFILTGGFWDDSATWDEIYHHSLGIKSHFVLSGGERLYFSTYLAVGAYTSWSSFHRRTEARFSDNQMLEYKTEHIKKRNNGLFYMPGLQLNYQIFRKYFLGFDLSLFLFIDLENLDLYTSYDYPVLPEYYNASLTFGIKL